MSRIISCEFCGSNKKVVNSACEGCGASSSASLVETQGSEGFVQSIAPVIKDAQRSRILLTATSLMFAILVGIFWHKSQVADRRSEATENSATLASMVGRGGVYHKKAMLGNAMGDVSILKFMVHEYISYNGEFPASIADLGADPERMVSRNIRSVSIEGEGTLLIQLSKKLGDDKTLRLVPVSTMDGRSIHWDCFSNLESYILTNMSCESTLTTTSSEGVLE